MKLRVSEESCDLGRCSWKLAGGGEGESIRRCRRFEAAFVCFCAGRHPHVPVAVHTSLVFCSIFCLILVEQSSPDKLFGRLAPDC